MPGEPDRCVERDIRPIIWPRPRRSIYRSFGAKPPLTQVITTRLSLSRRIASPVCSALAGLAVPGSLPSAIPDNQAQRWVGGPRVSSAGGWRIAGEPALRCCSTGGLDTRRTSRAALLKSVKVRAPHKPLRREWLTAKRRVQVAAYRGNDLSVL